MNITRLGGEGAGMEGGTARNEHHAPGGGGGGMPIQGCSSGSMNDRGCSNSSMGDQHSAWLTPNHASRLLSPKAPTCSAHPGHPAQRAQPIPAALVALSPTPLPPCPTPPPSAQHQHTHTLLSVLCLHSPPGPPA